MFSEGDTVLVAHRRLVRGDAPHFFVGRGDACQAGVVKATGHSYVRDPVTGRMVEKTDRRTTVLTVASGTLLVYQLPFATVVEAVSFTWAGGRVTAADGTGFSMNLGGVARGGWV